MTAAYEEDLAYIHDVGYGAFAESAAQGILDLFRKEGLASGTVADLGCGSGIWARALDAAGYGVFGVDISAAMIALCRQRVPRGRFEVGSLFQVELPPCVAVTSLGECVNYLFDEDNGLAALRALFARVHHALRPGGLFVFDLAEPGRGDGPSQRHRLGPDWAALVDVEEDAATRRLTRRITTFRLRDDGYGRAEEIHELQLYGRDQIVPALREAGFSVEVLSGYGDQAFPPAYVGFLARKR